MRNRADAKTPSRDKTYSVGIRSGIFGILSNALLFAAKLTVGLLIRSIAVTADAFNNLSDGASSVITVAGYKFAARPADREHPFGHARFEYIAALIVSVVMLVIGALFLKESVEEIFVGRDTPDVRAFAYVVLGISIALKGAQAVVYGVSYKKTGSLPMKAAATDSVGDMLATAAALLSTILWSATGLDLDGYFGTAISLFIIVTGIRLLKDSVSPLLGTPPLEGLVGKLKGKILSYDGVLGVHDVTIHSYGEKHAYAVVHIEVSASETLLHAHELVDAIERDVLEELGVQLVAHVDPRTETGGGSDFACLLRAYLSDRFDGLAVHDLRITEENGKNQVYFDAEIPWESSLTGAEIVAALKSFDPDHEYFVTEDRK